MRLKFRSLFITVAGSVLLPLVGKADTTFTLTPPPADAFLATGSSVNPVGTDLTSFNFGGAGTLAIAPASSLKGRFDSILKFNTVAAISQFNTTYGAGNWLITGFTLSLASNFGDQGEQPNNGVFNTINAGNFGIDWLGYDGWVEGTGSGMGTTGYPNNTFVSFNSIATLYSGGSVSLGTFTYTPPGDNIYRNYTLPLNASLVSDAMTGGDLSLYFYAADNQVSYLFNARSFAQNRPQLTLSAAAVPEPGVFALLTVSFGGFVLLRKSND
ncbi:MAG: hypothetical protein QM813_28255 [Verrucomicrobiota bacterium]